MLLAIDAGNTNTVFAIIEDEKIIAQWRASTSSARTAEEYWVWLVQLMQLDGIDHNRIKGAIIATVVPQAMFNLRALCRKFLQTEPMVVGDPAVDLGLEVHLDHPEVVGADRLVNAVAGHKSYPGALILVDFGTATTFDIVSAEGHYEGGIISPGANLSLEALHLAAAKLPRIAIHKPAGVIGRDTVSAMQSGVFWGYVGLIEGLVERIKNEYQRDMTVIATGGLAGLFNRSTDAIQHVDPDLTIRGLVAIHVRNVQSWLARPRQESAL
ncbi:MAG: type III pantothenate kinase [Alphaproteobacteria bacterium]